MTNKSETTDKKPSHRIYQVKGEGRGAIWIPVAAAWKNKDGKGFSIEAPFIGRLVMREIEASETPASDLEDNGGSL